MIADILIALVIALFLEMISFIGNYFKHIAIFAMCLTIVFEYFINHCQINFIGTIDPTIWILFVIMFDEVLMLIERICKKFIKD